MQNLKNLSRPLIDHFRFCGDEATWPNFQADMTRIMLRLDPQTPFRPTFHITDEKGLNAFTFKDEKGGNHIAFSKGIIKFFDNEDQLAFVLGHELGHPTFQKKYNPKFNERTQENYADLHSVDMMIAGGYRGEEAAVCFEKFHAVVTKKKADADRNEFFDPHSPLSSRVEAIQAHIHANWQQAGRYPVSPAPTPLSKESTHHPEVAQFESTWDLLKTQKSYNKLAPLAKLALIRQNIDQPNPFLRRDALADLPKLGLNPTHPAHTAAIDELANYYLNIHTTNPKEVGQTAPDQERFYKQALGALGLKEGTLGGLKQLQQAFDVLAQANNTRAVKAAAVQVAAAWKEVEQCFKGKTAGRLPLSLVAFQAFPAPELVDGAIPTPAPWEAVLQALKETRGERSEKAHEEILHAAALAGLLHDRRFHEYAQVAPRLSAVVQPAPEVVQAMQKLEPSAPEFPELYEQKLRPAVFFKQREALRRLVPLEQAATFRDLQNYLKARPSLFAIPLTEPTAPEADDGKFIVTPDKLAAHRGVIASLERIRANQDPEIFQEQVLHFMGKYLHGEGSRSQFDLGEDYSDREVPGAALHYRDVQQLYVDYVMAEDGPFDAEHRLQFLQELHYNAARPGEEKKFLSALELELPENFAGQLAEDLPAQPRPLLAEGEEETEAPSETEEFLDILESSVTTAALAEHSLHAELTGSAGAPDSLYAPPVEGVLKAFARLSMQNPSGRSIVSPRILRVLDAQLGAFDAAQAPLPEGVLARLGPERLLAHVRRLDGYGLVADKAHLQEQMNGLVIDAISGQEAFKDRHRLYLSMMRDNTVSDPQLAHALVKGWAANIRGRLGIDDNPAFAQRIRPFLRQVRKEANRKELFEELANQVEAQETVCKTIQDHLAFTTSDIYPLGFSIDMADELVGLCDRNPAAREATLEFFTNRYTGEGTRRYAQVLLDQGGMAPLRQLSGQIGLGGGPLTKEDALGIAHLPLASVHKRFWALPIGIRATILSNIIVGPPTKVDHAKSAAAFTLATEQVLSKVFPGDTEESLASRDLLRAFNKACRSDTERGVVLGALMAGQQRGGASRGTGEILAAVLADMGPAYVKLGQSIESHPLTPASIKKSLAGLKGNADLPPRWEIWERINQAAAGIKARIVHLGKPLGSASVNVGMAAVFDNKDRTIDPTEGELFTGVLLLQRQRALARANVGFEQMSRTVDFVEYPVLKNHQGELKEMIGEAHGLIGEELGNASEKKEQVKNFRALYDAKRVTAQGVSFVFDSVRIPVIEDEFMIEEMAPGVHFKDLPAGPYKAALAEAYYKFEMANILAGKPFDYDRHGKQCKVDPVTDRVKLFDVGGMARENPKPEQIEQLGRYFGRLARANVKALFTGKSDDLSLEILNESIAKERKSGNAPTYLMRLRKAALNIGDFYAEIPEERRAIVGRDLLLGAEVHPVIAQKIDQGMFHCRALAQKAVALQEWWQRTVVVPKPQPAPRLQFAKVELPPASFQRASVPAPAAEIPAPRKDKDKETPPPGPVDFSRVSLC